MTIYELADYCNKLCRDPEVTEYSMTLMSYPTECPYDKKYMPYTLIDIDHVSYSPNGNTLVMVGKHRKR